MSIERLVSKYVASADHAFETMEVMEDCAIPHADDIKRVVESARAYLSDAKHFMNEGKFEVGLTSVAYCEGLLDALRLLGVVRFKWPSEAEARGER